MNELEIIAKRRVWRRVLLAGILVFVISLLTLVSMYMAGMAEAKSMSGVDSEIELEIAALSARNQVIFQAAKWTLPIAILGSLLMNIARYKLRKLKK